MSAEMFEIQACYIYNQAFSLSKNKRHYLLKSVVLGGNLNQKVKNKDQTVFWRHYLLPRTACLFTYESNEYFCICIITSLEFLIFKC